MDLYRSGKTFHLPPAYILELPEEEVKGNAMAEKLASRKLLSVTPLKSGGSAKKKSPSPKRRPRPKGEKAK